MSTIQVDRIIPFSSASVTIEGNVVQADAATTGSNTFVGDQNIQGTITASIAEGFALVGGVGDISTLVATSSFGGGAGFPFTGDAQITGSLLISGSAGNDLVVEGRMLISGPTSGQTPQFIISGSDSTNTVGRTSLQISVTTGSLQPVISVASGSGVNTGNQHQSFIQSTQIFNADVSSSSAIKRIAIAANPSKLGVATLSAVTQPSLLGANNIGAPYQVLEIQSQGNFTDGTISFKVPVAVTGSISVSGSSTFTGNQTISGTTLMGGTLTHSGSGFVSERNQFKTAISGSNTLNQMFAGSSVISGSSHRNSYSQRNIEISKPGFNFPVFHSLYSPASSSFLFNFTENLTQTASYTVGVFDNGFTQDVEFQILTDVTNGVQLQDIDSVSGLYTTFLKIAPNAGTNPPLQFKRSAEVTGSVNISQVLKLGAQDPLPANGVGQLAVSGSNLFYNDGSTWTQIN